MYIPDHIRPTDEDVAELLANLGAADLVSATGEGLLATFLPLIHEPAGSTAEAGPGGRGRGRVRAMAVRGAAARSRARVDGEGGSPSAAPLGCQQVPGMDRDAERPLHRRRREMRGIARIFDAIGLVSGKQPRRAEMIARHGSRTLCLRPEWRNRQTQRT